MRRGVDRLDHAVALGDDGDAGVARDDALDAGADERRRRPDERHRLALHVRTHERAVGVVVLEERNQRRGDRHQLVRRDVHQLDVLGLGHDEVAVVAARHRRRRELALLVDRRVRLGDDVALLLERRVELDLVGDLAVARPCGTASR